MDLVSHPVSSTVIQRKLKSNGKTVLEYSIKRPSFPNSGNLRRMEQYFAQTEHQWQMRWENQLFLQATKALDRMSDYNLFHPWHASMDYEITFWKDPLLSIRIDIKEQGPVTPPVSLCIGEVWDCSSGYPCSLRTFLPVKQLRWKSKLISQLQKQAKQRLNSGDCLFHTECLAVIKQKFDSNRFYLTEDGLVIFYPLYILGSYGEGIPTFTIPIESQIQSNKFRALSKTAHR